MARTGDLAILGRLGQQGTDIGGVASIGDNLVITTRPELHRRLHIREAIRSEQESQPRRRDGRGRYAAQDAQGRVRRQWR